MGQHASWSTTSIYLQNIQMGLRGIRASINSPVHLLCTNNRPASLSQCIYELERVRQELHLGRLQSATDRAEERAESFEMFQAFMLLAKATREQLVAANSSPDIGGRVSSRSREGMLCVGNALSAFAAHASCSQGVPVTVNMDCTLQSTCVDCSQQILTAVTVH